MKRDAGPWHICVLIPDCNEETLLPRCLQSVLKAKAHLQQSAKVDILVIADNSTDHTAQIAADTLKTHGIVSKMDAGVVGLARAQAAEIALARYRGPLGPCWLANTDADCIVPLEWLAEQISLADKGIEAVAGTVNVDDFGEHGPFVRRRFEATYLIGVDGSHSHVHGANLDVRADI